MSKDFASRPHLLQRINLETGGQYLLNSVKNTNKSSENKRFRKEARGVDNISAVQAGDPHAWLIRKRDPTKNIAKQLIAKIPK